MPVRRATTDDILPLAELWATAFPDGPGAAARADQLRRGLPYGDLDTTFLDEDGGRLRGAYRAYRLVEYLAGVPLPMMGLAAVAVSPSHRRKGVAGELCRCALRAARERGDAVSVLFPFRPDFYRRLGWGSAGRMHAHLFRPEALPDHPDERARVRSAGPAERNAIVNCYERVAAASNGLLRRSERLWSHLLQDERTRVFVYDDHGVKAYVITRFAGPHRPALRTLFLRELVAEDESGTRGLLAWAAAQRDQFPRIRYDARADEAFERRLSDPRPPGHGPVRTLWYPVGRILEGPMLRVLDVGAALRAPRVWGGAEPVTGEVWLVVRDPELPENEGPWRLVVREGVGEVDETTEPSGGARLETDAATFGSIYAGELAPSAAVRLGLAAAEGNHGLLDAVFRVERRFWLLDVF